MGSKIKNTNIYRRKSSEDFTDGVDVWFTLHIKVKG